MKILLTDDHGTPLKTLEGITLSGDGKLIGIDNLTATLTPSTVPEIVASPTAQGIVDALVELGFVTQAEA